MIGRKTMSEEEPIIVQYHNLIAYYPGLDSTEQHEWLHFKCEGNLQIGNDGTIRCEKCNTQQPALTWYMIDETHLSQAPPEARQLNFSDVTSLAGQVTAKAGKEWLSEFLSHIEE